MPIALAAPYNRLRLGKISKMPICHGWMPITNGRRAGTMVTASVISEVQLLVDNSEKGNNSMIGEEHTIGVHSPLASSSLVKYPKMHLRKQKWRL